MEAAGRTSAAMVLETPRLTLRPWRDDDIEPWVAMCADARVTEFFAGTYDRARAERIAAKTREVLAEKGYGWWALEVKGKEPFIGTIVLQDVPFDAPFTPAIEVGWWLAPEHWGNGYATEGARAALSFAFDTLHAAEIVAITSELNLRSQRVMERLGMTRDPLGDFEHPAVDPGDKLRPHVLYRIRP